MLKNKKGITLVALIITIIVLLILAVVAIQEIAGDGIITYAITAVEEYQMAQIKEEAEEVKANAQIEYSISDATLGQTELVSEIQNSFEGSTISGNSIITKNGKYKILVDENLNITVIKNEERELVKGDVKVTHTVTKTNSGYNVNLTMELVGIPEYDWRKMEPEYLENEYLPGMTKEELLVLGGEIMYPGAGLSAETVYNEALKSQLDDMPYDDFVVNGDAKVQEKYGYPSAAAYVKQVMIVTFTNVHTYVGILDNGGKVVYSKQLLPELVGKPEAEIRSTVEGWYNNTKTFDKIVTEITGKATIEEYMLELNKGIGEGYEALNFFNREQTLIYIAGRAYAKSHPILVTKPDGTIQEIDWFANNSNGKITRSYSVTEVGIHNFKVTGISGYTEEIRAMAGIAIILDKEEITALGETTLTATLVNLDENSLTWTSSNEDVVQIEGTGATVKVIAKTAGEETITATCGEYTATCKVKIEGSISLDKEEITTIGETTLTATLVNLDENSLIWTSSNEDVIQIDGTGAIVKLIPNSGGTATITATCGKYSATCKINVIEAIVDESGNYARGKILSYTTHTNVYDKNGKKIVVPAGFMIPEEIGYNYVEDGIVIRDEAGNEFVWIPVNNLNSFARLQDGSTEDYRGVLYDWTSSGYPEHSWSIYDSREPDVLENYDGKYLSQMEVTTDLNKDGKTDISDAKYQLQKEFNNMVKSVGEYDGFYVGRYEMSYNGTAQSKKSTELNPITSSKASDSATNMWYGLYSKAKTYTNINNSVKSSMIWRCQYDAMISFLGSAAHTKIGDNRNKSDRTGSVETDKIKNVYDLYGNRYEWILSAFSTYSRENCGGDYNSDKSPSSRNFTSPTDKSSRVGSRLSLYIKVQE